MEANFEEYMCNGRGSFTDEFCLALAPLLIELLKQLPSQQLPDFALVGLIMTLTHTLMARRKVVELLLDEHDALKVLDGVMRQVTPEQLVSTAKFSRHPQGIAIHAIKDIIQVAQSSGRDLLPELLDMGYIKLLLETINTVPKVGGSQKCNGFVCAWGYASTLPLLYGKRIEEIYTMIREERSALRWMVDNNIGFVDVCGLGSSTFALMSAAILFGKDEDDRFGIPQEDIDRYVRFDTEIMNPQIWGQVVNVGPAQGRALLSLCVSDRNKSMLIKSPGFIPHLISSLMLNPKHLDGDQMQNTPEEIKTIVQIDYAECIQQMSLYEAGCEALKQPEVVEALDELVEKGWSKKAKRAATGALMNLCPERHNERHGELSGHVMCSYQWDVQVTISRLAKSLQKRKFNVWLDVMRCDLLPITY